MYLSSFRHLITLIKSLSKIPPIKSMVKTKSFQLNGQGIATSFRWLSSWPKPIENWQSNPFPFTNNECKRKWLQKFLETPDRPTTPHLPTEISQVLFANCRQSVAKAGFLPTARNSGKTSIPIEFLRLFLSPLIVKTAFGGYKDFKIF